MRIKTGRHCDFSNNAGTCGGTRRRLVAGGVAGVALAMLAACGGDGAVAPAEDPLRAYREQAVNWQACDPETLGGESPAYLALKERLSCATIRVPLDYAEPGRGDAVVAVTRVAAGTPAQRQGAILVNPGGPGGDGLAWSLFLGASWSFASDSSTTGQQLRVIPQRYDLIGFSPRGVGASSRLYCGTNGTLMPERHSSDRSEANIAAMVFNARATADACIRNPLARYINTDSTVRDMDLIRELLGDAKLNYVGISYGTWLGAWYASLFPERVGRMVLDSSMDVTGAIDVNVVLQPTSIQRVLDSFIPAYAVRHPDRFALGGDPAAIAGVYRELSEPLRVAFDREVRMHAIVNLTARVAKGAQLIAAARGLNQIVRDDPDNARNPAVLEDKLMDYPFAPDSFGDDNDIRGLALSMVRPYIEAYEPAGRQVEIGSADSVFQAVVCNDTATRTDLQYWVDLGNQMARSHPYAGGTVTRNPCVTWGGPAVSKPPLSRAAAASPILMLQSEFDALTATEGALRTFDQLPQAHMVMVGNHYTHGVLTEGMECVDAVVGRYFADGVVPGRRSDCEGPALPGEDSVEARRVAPALAREQPGVAALAREELRRRLDAIAVRGQGF